MKKIIYIFFDSILLGIIVLKNFLYSLNFLNFKNNYIDNCKKKVLVICHGPSLKDNIEFIKKNQSSYQIYSVNYFANTDYFPEIKPKYYLIADPVLWLTKVTSDYIDENKKLYDNLNSIQWKMTIVCPEKGYKFIKNRIKNKFIKVEKINCSTIDFKNEKFSIFALRWNLITPTYSTAAVMALWHAILNRKKDIIIYGADFSYFKEFKVDQKTNQLSNAFPRFYKNSKAENNGLAKYPNRSQYMIHERLQKCTFAFYQMYLVSRVAENLKINIINASNDSYLDCFPRT